MELSDDIKTLKGIGGKTSALFNKVGVFSLWDLVRYVPRSYERFPSVGKVRDLKLNEENALFLTLKTDLKAVRAGRLMILSAVAEDSDGGIIRLKWFNSFFLQKILGKNSKRIFSGRAVMGREGAELVQPRYFSEEEYKELTGILQPVYPLTKGLSGKTIINSVRQVLNGVSIEDFLSEKDREELKLMELNEAFKILHQPENEEDVVRARKRIAFNEFLSLTLKIRSLKEENSGVGNRFRMIESSAALRLTESLPYELTSSQKKAYQDILKDFSSDTAMNRLLQGDVGSGKTIIAFLAMVTAAENGYQAALMAPTEVLASQHAEKLNALLSRAGLPFKTVLLTGSLSEKEKRSAREEISSGEAKLIIGTHALIQDQVRFKSLALAVTDEQHRFGVRQREDLSGETVPHTLVMSATPIPRTLAIILYGDLDISLMESLPEKRRPIKNCVVGPDYRSKAWSFISDEVKKGHQAYVICPLVEESEGIMAENVTDYAEKLKGVYGDRVRVGVLHGRMNNRDKVSIMDRFKSGETDVLVSTTVVEVGVDVPNATVMMIENAERFGLSSLHQIRGRVGRGEEQGYCIFMDTSGKKEENKRLKVLNGTNDGFKIADEDLKLRGPGELFGLRQSGEMDFDIADIYNDADMLRLAASFADRAGERLRGKLKEYDRYEQRIVL